MDDANERLIDAVQKLAAAAERTADALERMETVSEEQARKWAEDRDERKELNEQWRKAQEKGKRRKNSPEFITFLSVVLILVGVIIAAILLTKR